MNARTILEEVYVEYVASALGPATAKELARLSGGELSHDQITRALGGAEHGARELWARVKPLVRAQERAGQAEGAVLVVDDTIIPKPHSQESEVVGWWFDHCEGRPVKGINLLTLFWQSEALRVPVGFAVVRKQAPSAPGARPTTAVDKNTLFRALLQQARANALPFCAVLADVWFASEANLELIAQGLGATFVFALKANRQAAPWVAAQSRREVRSWQAVGAMALEEERPRRAWLRGVNFPVALLRHRYTNADGSGALIHLCTNAPELSGEQILALQKRRWSVEVYHKSLKQNAAAGRAPLWSVRATLNHLWASLCAYVRWERLRLRHHSNHFALKARIRLAAQQSALCAFRALSSA